MSIENAHNSAELLINSNNCSIMNYMYKLYKIYYEQVYYFDTINNKVEKTIKKKRQPSTSCLIEKGKKRTEEENVNIEDDCDSSIYYYLYCTRNCSINAGR